MQSDVVWIVIHIGDNTGLLCHDLNTKMSRVVHIGTNQIFKQEN
jgi:hypothetical protein